MKNEETSLKKKNPAKNGKGMGQRKGTLSYLRRHWIFYAMLALPLLYYYLFSYRAMPGVVIAFKEFNMFKGIWESPWVGLQYFERVAQSKTFWLSVRNMMTLNILGLVLGFPLPIILALFLNEISHATFKKTVQTVIYLPHFMSWAVVASIFSLFLSPSSTGMVNGLLRDWGILKEADKNIYFLANTTWWRPIYWFIQVWKETGWGTIIYLATLSGINPELYEAADIDGATRMQKIRFVTLPALTNTIITVLILNLAKVMNLFESVFVLYNNAVFEVSDVIATYIYRQTFAIALPNYGYSTAVGLFRSLVGCVLVLICNYASKRVRGRGIV